MNVSDIDSLLSFFEEGTRRFEVSTFVEKLFFRVNLFDKGLLFDIKYFDKELWFEDEGFGFEFLSVETSIEVFFGIISLRTL